MGLKQSTLRRWAPAPGTTENGSAAERLTVGVLGIQDGRLATVSGAIQAGFRFGAFSRLANILGVDQRVLAGLLGISAGTLARRREKNRFSPYESDRMWMLLRLYLRAVQVLGSAVAAREWLSAPLPALGRRSALEVTTDAAGAERALGVLGQIHHGVFG